MDSKLIKKTKQAAAARAEVSISSAYRIWTFDKLLSLPKNGI
jgi:hypothetical protein